MQKNLAKTVTCTNKYFFWDHFWSAETSRLKANNKNNIKKLKKNLQSDIFSCRNHTTRSKHSHKACVLKFGEKKSKMKIQSYTRNENYI